MGLIVAAVILYVGLTGKELLFIHTARGAAISLGVVGMILCGSGTALERCFRKAPAHPLSILGYLVGATGLFTFLVQVFKWQVPVISDPRTALIVLGAVIGIKFVIGRLTVLVPKMK